MHSSDLSSVCAAVVTRKVSSLGSVVSGTPNVLSEVTVKASNSAVVGSVAVNMEAVRLGSVENSTVPGVFLEVIVLGSKSFVVGFVFVFVVTTDVS